MFVCAHNVCASCQRSKSASIALHPVSWHRVSLSSHHSPALRLQVQACMLGSYIGAEDPHSGLRSALNTVHGSACELHALVNFYGHSDIWNHSLSCLNCFDYKTTETCFLLPFQFQDEKKYQCPPSHEDSGQNHIALLQLGKVQYSIIFYPQ